MFALIIEVYNAMESSLRGVLWEAEFMGNRLIPTSAYNRVIPILQAHTYYVHTAYRTT